MGARSGIQRIGIGGLGVLVVTITLMSAMVMIAGEIGGTSSFLGGTSENSTDNLGENFTGSENESLMCPNGVCDPGESVYTCPEDCGYCGDGICDPTETNATCTVDCRCQGEVEAAFTISPEYPNPMSNVSFRGDPSTPGSDCLTYDWLGEDAFAATGQNAFHNFTDTGEYTVQLTVENEEGVQDTVERTITVWEIAAPIPELTWTPNTLHDFPGDPDEGDDGHPIAQDSVEEMAHDIVLGDTVTFDASGSHDTEHPGSGETGEVVKYEYDFDGDGQYDDTWDDGGCTDNCGDTIQKTFDESSGSKTINLRVTDDDGYSTERSFRLYVLDNQPPDIDDISWEPTMDPDDFAVEHEDIDLSVDVSDDWLSTSELEIEWDLNNDWSDVEATGTSATVSYPGTGVKNVRVRVRDDISNWQYGSESFEVRGAHINRICNEHLEAGVFEGCLTCVYYEHIEATFDIYSDGNGGDYQVLIPGDSRGGGDKDFYLPCNYGAWQPGNRYCGDGYSVASLGAKERASPYYNSDKVESLGNDEWTHFEGGYTAILLEDGEEVDRVVLSDSQVQKDTCLNYNQFN